MFRMRRIRTAMRIAVVTMCGMFLSAAAWAQATSGIAGVVRDDSGGVIPGVTVEASSPVLIEKVRSVVTDTQGQYRILSLLPGTYTVTFTLTGFSTVIREGIELTSNFTATVDADLKVGTLAETVTVSGQSPVVDIQNVVQQRVISRQLLYSLPTNGETNGFAGLTVGATIGRSSQDVGGNKDPQATISVHGSRSGDTRTLIDGMYFNGEGYGRGFYFNPAAAQEVTLQFGGAAAEVEVGGVQVNLIPKEGGNRFHGTWFSNYSNKNMTSDNLTAEIRARGLNSVNRTLWTYEANGSVGGPIKEDKLWFFTHHRFWGFKNSIAGGYFNKTPGTMVYTPDSSRQSYRDQIAWADGLRLTWQASQRNKFNLSYDIQKTCLACRGGGSALAAPETARQTIYGVPNYFAQVKWNFTINNRLLFEAGDATLIFNWPSYRRPETFGAIAIRDAATNFSYGAPTAIGGKRIANQTNQRVGLTFVTGTHAFKTGYTMEFGWHDWEWDYYGTGGKNGLPALPLDYGFFNGVPNSLTLYATPVELAERLQPNLGLFAQDQWTIKHVTLSYGLRFDYLNAFVPKRHLEAGPFVPARDFAQVDCAPCWKDFDPRLGVAWDLFGNGKTAIKASVSRYVEADRYFVVRSNNPVQTSVNSTTRTWGDLNGNFVPDCDLANPLENAECGQNANLNFGKTDPRATSFASDVLKGWGVRMYGWETSVAIQHELRPGMAVSAGYFRTWYGNFRANENVALTPADFDVYTFVAPVDPRLPGGGGYAVPGLYDVKPAKFGQNRTVLSKALNYGKQSEIYNGFDLTLSARLPRGVLSGGWNTGRQILNDCDVLLGRPQMTPVPSGLASLFTPLNARTTGMPLTEAYCKNGVWQQQVKVQGTYDLPWGLKMGATFQSLPGIPISAAVTATSAQIAPYLGRPLASGPRGTAVIQLIAPDTQFEDRLTQLDIRTSRVFRVGRNRIEAMVDVYNALNSHSILSINTNYGPSWLTPTEVLGSRLLKVGFQFEF